MYEEYGSSGSFQNFLTNVMIAGVASLFMFVLHLIWVADMPILERAVFFTAFIVLGIITITKTILTKTYK